MKTGKKSGGAKAPSAPRLLRAWVVVLGGNTIPFPDPNVLNNCNHGRDKERRKLKVFTSVPIVDIEVNIPNAMIYAI